MFFDTWQNLLSDRYVDKFTEASGQDWYFDQYIASAHCFFLISNDEKQWCNINKQVKWKHSQTPT